MQSTRTRPIGIRVRTETVRCGEYGTYVVDIEEQALQVAELGRGETQQTGRIVEDSAGGGLVSLQSICILAVRNERARNDAEDTTHQ